MSEMMGNSCGLLSLPMFEFPVQSYPVQRDSVSVASKYWLDPQKAMFMRDAAGGATATCDQCNQYCRTHTCDRCIARWFEAQDRHIAESRLFAANATQYRREKRLLNHSAHLVGGWKRNHEAR